MKLKLLLFLAFSLTITVTNAQTNFKKGYVIKAITDTLFGEIDYRDDYLMNEACRFRINEKEKETVFLPEDIIGYRFPEGKYFISKRIGDRSVFLKFLIKGVVNVYYLKDNTGERYFLEKEGSDIIEIPKEDEYKYVDNKVYTNNSPMYRGLLKYYMGDAPNLASRINDIGSPDYHNLIKLAKDYHNEVCKDEACIVFEEKAPFIKIEIEALAGVMNFFDYKGTFFQKGILGHIWMPRASENLFFRTGMVFSTIEDEEESATLIKIPLQFEYKYPKGMFRPVLAYGANMYNGMIAIGFMGGLNIKFSQSIYMGMNYDLDFIPNDKFLLIPKKIFSQSASAGLLIKF